MNDAKTEFNLEKTAFLLLSKAKAMITKDTEQTKAQIALHYHYALHTPRLFHDNLEKVQYIINELLQQAVKSTQEGSITLSIYHNQHDPQSIVLSVTDTRKNPSNDSKISSDTAPSYIETVTSLKGKTGSNSDTHCTCHWVSLNLALSEKRNNLTINSLGGHSIAFICDDEDTLENVNQYLEDWGAKSYCSKVNTYNHIPIDKFDLLIINLHDYQLLKYKPSKIPIVLLENQQLENQQPIENEDQHKEHSNSSPLNRENCTTLAWPNTTDKLLDAIIVCLGIK